MGAVVRVFYISPSRTLAAAHTREGEAPDLAHRPEFGVPYFKATLLRILISAAYGTAACSSYIVKIQQVVH